MTVDTLHRSGAPCIPAHDVLSLTSLVLSDWTRALMPVFRYHAQFCDGHPGT